MIALSIFATAFLLLNGMIILCDKSDMFEWNRSQILTTICTTIALILLIIYIALISNKPTAIDVYQGKTTLEITYKGSIPIDSTVVFK